MPTRDRVPAAGHGIKGDPFSAEVLSPALIGGAMLQNGFATDQLATGIAVALAESGGRRKAVNHNSNGSVDVGLWQINSVHRQQFAETWPQWANAIVNTGMAKAVHDAAGGWSPWVAYSSGSYRTHLLAAKRGAKAAIAGPSMEEGLHEVNPAEAAAGAAGAVAHGIGGMWDALIGILTWLADPHNWLRIVEIVAGGAALLLGAYLLARSGAAGDSVKQAAGDAAAAAKLAAIA